MAKLFPDALLLIVSLFNIFTLGCSALRVGELQSSPNSADDSSSALHLQTEEEVLSPSHARTRSKRCTCYSFKDRECVYYCHLGIIWINTPQRTVPYGMSSHHRLQRLRRSSSVIIHRCSCADQHDPECLNFCDASS